MNLVQFINGYLICQVEELSGNPGCQVDAKISPAPAASRLGQINTHHIPSLLSVPTRNHMDITTPPVPMVAPEVLRVAEHRHRKGLMYPYVFQVLTKVCRSTANYIQLNIYIKMLF